MKFLRLRNKRLLIAMKIDDIQKDLLDSVSEAYPDWKPKKRDAMMVAIIAKLGAQRVVNGERAEWDSSASSPTLRFSKP